MARIARTSRSNLFYPTAAPVFADADHMADIIGQARTAAEAKAIYTTYYANTDVIVVNAIKATPDREDGPADGWIPEMTDAWRERYGWA